MENLFLYFIFFILGTIMGSFLNCLVCRLHKKEDFLVKRSYCPYCKHTLSWKDLIPVLSFLLLKGKCRYCGQRISLQYILAELTTGILFVLALTQHSYFLLLAFSFLVVIFIYDFKYYIIPDKVIFPAIAITFLYQLVSNFQSIDIFYSAVISALAAAGFFLSIFLISRGRWIGFGDVKLALFMGLLLNFPGILVAMFFSFFIGAIIGTVLIALNKKGLKSEVPFGPFLMIGTLIGLFWGEKIFSWYLSLLHV